MKPEHKDFVNRLNEACDHHPDAPPPYRGRQRWLSKVISVSPEASRKWFAGEARPRPPVMKKIAEALKVDEGWLALGLTPIHEPSERKVAERRAGGAIYYIAGLIEMEGGTVAFPEGDDADAGVDLFATVRGRQRKLHVAPADRVAPGRYLAALPADHDKLLVLSVVMGHHGHCPRVLFLAPDLLDKHAQSRGGYQEVEMIADDGAFITGEDTWPEVGSFADLVGGLRRAV